MGDIYLYESRHQESYALNVHHHPYYQLLYGIEGNGQIALNGETRVLGQDHAVLIVPQEEHAVSSTTHLTLLVLAFDAASFAGPIPLASGQSLFPRSVHLQLSGFQATELRLLLRKLLFEQRQTEPLSGMATQIYIQELLLLLARAGRQTAAADANGLRAERIRAYIDQRYYEPLTAEDLAQQLSVGVRHANNIFKEQYQLTPMQYLTETRIRIACKLLVETDKDIVSICFEVGYESLPTFYRAFKNTVGVPPNQYRQQQRKQE